MTAEVNGQLSAVHKQREPNNRRWSRAVVASSALLGMLLASSGLLPTLLLHTSWRDRVLSSALKQETAVVTSSEASGGWLAPITFRNIRIEDSQGEFLCTIRELRTSRGLLGFLRQGSDPVQVDLIEPRVEFRINRDKTTAKIRPRQNANRPMRFTIQDGSVVVSVPWRETPIVDLDDLNLKGQIGPNPEGQQILKVDAAQILDREPLSESHTTQNLALIAPVLSQSTKVSGTASVWLHEMEIPLQGLEDVPLQIRGRAEFHSLNASLKKDWAQQLSAAAGQLAGTEVPEHIEVVRDSSVDFVVTGEGIRHEGMVFLLPEIAKELRITSSGLIRLDESIDLQLSVSVPQIISAGSPMLMLLSQLTAEPLRLSVSGTVSHPELHLPAGVDLISAVARRVAPAQYQQEAPPVPLAVMDLLQSVSGPDKSEAQKNIPGSILNLIRAIDQSGKEKPRDRPQRSRRKHKSGIEN